ncbi:Pyridoxal-dependent decarboxylase, exosortase A system-associated [Sphingomonas sp. EC-HK361]|uniref:pyridoxal-dependent decarboxylase, exosortase A system-associated n=1 Tax=Sphingomonas sp. EC-HK361 TaxID=2038397 RepID=UPI00125A227B|nr:pyridoxal-dependent decarboxylase, exosortase A system-associated [Sphingomonas sp. EC-HK361]VVT03801.1 Pyridoxal-dependent decarboxylase, exosortase A system-associated [Sphingomonas sp. EC-HK361]
MKPMGPLPPEFAAQTGVLRVGGRDLEALVAEAGTTPFFFYDLGIAAARVARFRAAFPGIDLHYAMKANPHPAVVAGMATMVDGLDVASGGEMDLALRSKPAGAISFAGPGKRDAELGAAIAAGVTLNVESEGETERALAIAARIGVAPLLAVRVNPDMELRGSGMKMGGRPSPFGVDEARVPALVRSIIDAGADWRGLHVYAGSQALDAQAIVDTQAETLALAGRIAQAVGVTPRLVNLGGGFGIPYFAGDTPPDIERVGRSLREATDNAAHSLTGTRFAIELGRWLVAEAGVYLTRVVDRKESRGETFLVVDGGLHHQLAASGNFGTVVRRNYPVAVAHRMGEPASETVSVVGCLCTPLDRLADRVALPRADAGDVIVIFLAGAYGATASPMAFLGHPPAAEIVLPPS